MINYKYQLDRSSKKFICPRCNKKTFVKYTDTETGKYLSETIGRCDSESSCAYFNKPAGENKKTFQIIDMPKPLPSYHKYDLVIQSKRNYNRNNFIRFLKTIFLDIEVSKAIRKYCIGTSNRWEGAAVFWQIDNLQRVHAGKILQYNVVNGKRVKEKDGKGLIDWVHSTLKRKNVLKEFQLYQCLFGLHLITDGDTKTIGIVESEKTAIIMSLFKPNYIWLATGSKQGFKFDMLQPIKPYKVIAFPDKSEYNDWLSKAKELNGFGFDITVNDWLELTTYEAGTDLADVYIIEKTN
jgi:hypothetical protein